MAMATDDVGIDMLDEAEQPTVFCLEFVNMNANSAAEKQRNQKVIRSTAMKNFRRRQQSQRTQQAKETSKTSFEAHSHPSLQQTGTRKKPDKQHGVEDFDKEHYFNTKVDIGQGELEASSQAIHDWIFETTSKESWLGNQTKYYTASKNMHEENSVWEDSAIQCQTLPTYRSLNDFNTRDSPLTLLTGGRVDPFRTYPVSYVGPHIHELIDHSTTSLWPGLRPRGENGIPNKISSAWLEKVTSRPLVMHALLFGGAVHMDVLRSPRINPNNPVRLFHKVQTMRLLKEELKNPDLSDPDELILAVLCLGANEVETMMENMKPKTRSPFISPLSSSQWLDVYGSMSHIKAHTLAMRSLVDRQGGLENIRLEGLAEVVQFSDILGATQTLSRPYWPLLERTTNFDLDNRRGSESGYHPPHTLGQGFQALRAFGLGDGAEFVLQALADLTIVIERYSRGIVPVPELSHVIDRRNYAQHALLSLPTADELEVADVSNAHLYEAIRYATLIYSIGVTFPLPTITGIYSELTTRLRSTLEKSQADLCWSLHPKTLLWVLTLGGIAASVTENQRWYVQTLAVVSAALDIARWDDVAEVMAQYLWLERACDAGGRTLWQNVLLERCLDVSFEGEI